MTTDDDLRRAFDFTAGDERLDAFLRASMLAGLTKHRPDIRIGDWQPADRFTPAWQPYAIEAHGDGTATWHCHHCDDAKHHPDPDAARTDADAHHDLWHTNGGDK